MPVSALPSVSYEAWIRDLPSVSESLPVPMELLGDATKARLLACVMVPEPSIATFQGIRISC